LSYFLQVEVSVAEFIVGNSMRHLARENRFLQRMLWRLDFAFIWLLKSCFMLMPIDKASRLGYRIGSWIGPRMKKKTVIYRENMALAFPDLNDVALDQLVTRAWGQAGRILGEYPHLDTFNREEDRLEIDIREPLAACSNPARPCVVVTAHLSNWEVVGSAMARLGIPNDSLYSPPSNPLLDQMLMESRQALNCRLLPRDNSAKLLMRTLKEGRTAGIVVDRRVENGQPISFFGHDKDSTLLPAKLALKYNCDLIPAQVERLEDARYRVIFHPPIRPTDLTVDEVAQAMDMIQQLHNQFEDWICQHPEDWFCSKRLWPKGTIAHQSEVTGHDNEIDSCAA
jgi:KDO2-lipid IV(A) lauroyltransferase